MEGVTAATAELSVSDGGAPGAAGATDGAAGAGEVDSTTPPSAPATAAAAGATAEATATGTGTATATATGTACTSTLAGDCPLWLPDLQPQHYVYESEYVGADGQVDDDADKSALVNKFSNVPARLWQLRGPKYMEGAGATNNLALKQPSRQAAYSCVGINVFSSSSDLGHAAEKVQCLKKYLADMDERDAALEAALEAGGGESLPAGLLGDAPRYLVYVWKFANFFKTEHHCVVKVFKRAIKVDSSGSGEDPALDKALSAWLAMSDADKSKKLKYCPQFSECSKQLFATIDALGGQRPVIIGKKLNAKYHTGANYFEIDLDVGSSTIASMLKSVAVKSSANFVLDELACIEGQTADELPERALFGCRWNHCSIDACTNKLDDLGKLVD